MGSFGREQSIIGYSIHRSKCLVSELGQLLRVGGDLPLRSVQLPDQGLLPLVVGLRAGLALLLEPAAKNQQVSTPRLDRDQITGKISPADDLAVAPAELSRQPSDSTVLAAGLQPQDAEGLGHDHPLLDIVRRGDTLKDLQAVHRSLTTGSLVGDHATDGLVEDARRSTEMEESVGVVETGCLAEVGVVLHCARDRSSKHAGT